MLAVRETPSLKMDWSIESPSGRFFHWSEQETDPINVPRDWSHASTIPGGFSEASCALPRQPGRDFPDMERGSVIRAYEAGGECVWEGRLERSPRTSGDEVSISPSFVGLQASLEDDKSARAIIRDIDLTRWGPMSVQRKLNLLTANYGPGDASTQPDATTGQPALVTQQEGPWLTTSAPAIEGWYDAQGIDLGSVYYAWKKGSTVGLGGNWLWSVVLASDDVLSAEDTSGNLAAAGPGSGSLSATGDRLFARVLLTRSPADTTGSDNVAYPIFWTTLAVYGDHGLTLRGTEPDAGFYASDVIAHTIRSFAPQLNFSEGPDGSISESDFIIPQLAFLEPTTAAEMVTQANRFHLNDWAVWENATFYYHPRGARGKTWRARIGPSQLSEQGEQMDRVWNSIIVQYTDVDGSTRTVGPVGSGADTEDDVLKDDDPENVANKLGITKRDILTMGTATAAGATKIGQIFLDRAKTLDTSGQATLVGHVEDDHGVTYPASRVRAGDSIEFIDSNSPDPRRIVQASYSRSSRSTSVDLDSPAEGLQALLERLGVGLVRLGLS